MVRVRVADSRIVKGTFDWKPLTKIIKDRSTKRLRNGVEEGRRKSSYGTEEERPSKGRVEEGC